MARKFVLILSVVKHFVNISLFYEQNCLTLKSVRISFHADRYIIICIRCILLPPPSQFRQFKIEAASILHQIPKNNSAVPICTPTSPLFTVAVSSTHSHSPHFTLPLSSTHSHSPLFTVDISSRHSHSLHLLLLIQPEK
jgi:hypothetical protein